MRLRSIFILFCGIILVGASSCATVRNESLSDKEVRLLSVSIPGKENIKAHSPFMVEIKFEADGNPLIKTACFYFSGNGPRCFNVTDVNYGKGNIKVQVYTENAGSRLLECYVVYLRDGNAYKTNQVKSYFRFTPPP